MGFLLADKVQPCNKCKHDELDNKLDGREKKQFESFAIVE
jgi:hypothetical protein